MTDSFLHPSPSDAYQSSLNELPSSHSHSSSFPTDQQLYQSSFSTHSSNPNSIVHSSLQPMSYGSSSQFLSSDLSDSSMPSSSISSQEQSDSSMPQSQSQRPIRGGGLYKLFVGQVTPNTDENTLRRVFSPFGQIAEVVVLIDKLTGRGRGCGFVTYADKDSADSAIAHLNDKYQFPGAKRPAIVRYAGDKTNEDNRPHDHKLYVGMLSRESNEENIRSIFEPFGEVIEVFLMRDRVTSASKGQAFVRFARREDALRAITALDNKARDGSAPGLLQVRFAETHAEKSYKIMRNGPQGHPMSMHGGMGMMNMHGMSMLPGMIGMGGMGMPPHMMSMMGPAGMHSSIPMGHPYAQMMSNKMNPVNGSGETRGPEGANLFVYNLPDSYTDMDLLQLFSSFGSVLSTKVQKDPATGASKGFGFVSYSDTTNAQNAINAMNGFMVGNKRLTVRVKSGSSPVGVTSQAPRYRPY